MRTNIYRGMSDDDGDQPRRMPERKRSPRAKAETIARRQARAIKHAEVSR